MYLRDMYLPLFLVLNWEYKRHREILIIIKIYLAFWIYFNLKLCIQNIWVVSNNQ